MATHSRPCARGDYLFRRGGDMSVAVRWRQDSGSGYQPVDLTSWEAVLKLEDQFGTVLTEIECICTSDGFAIATVEASVWEESSLVGITQGSWRVIGTKDGKSRVLGNGYWEVN